MKGLYNIIGVVAFSRATPNIIENNVCFVYHHNNDNNHYVKYDIIINKNTLSIYVNNRLKHKVIKTFEFNNDKDLQNFVSISNLKLLLEVLSSINDCYFKNSQSSEFINYLTNFVQHGNN